MFERFSVGDAVTYRDGTVGTYLKCRITRVMPSEGGSGIYCARDLAENVERAVAGSTLTRQLRDEETDSHFKATNQ